MSSPGRRALPLVKPHEREHTYCAYCPKLCRFSCPVSTVTGRESVSPWGKMSALHGVAEGTLAMEPSIAGSWWACTGCGRCRTYCDHKNDVASALRAGRAEAFRADRAPSGARETVAQHAARTQRAANAGRALFPHAPVRGTIAYVPGCTACVVAPDAARDGAAVVEQLTGAAPRVVSDQCCGLPLLEAGDVDGFRGAAQRFAKSLTGATDVYVSDAGCAHALAVLAEEHGVRMPTRVRHTVELAAEHESRIRPVSVVGPVRYHDACRLGRGLGHYDPPRRVLTRALGRPPDEFSAMRENGECSGAGGLLPITDRATASAIAKDRVDAHVRVGGGAIVTTCAGSLSAFRKQVGEGGAVDLNTLVLRSVTR